MLARNGGPFDLHLAFEGSNLSKCKLHRPGGDPDIVIVIVVWVAFRALESQVKDSPILPFFIHATAVLALFVMTLQIWQHPSSSR